VPVQEVRINDNVVLGRDELVLIAGPCVVESADHTFQTAKALIEITRRARVPLIFKASFDKANRTSISSFRGIGKKEGLRALGRVREGLGIPVLTDIHEPGQAEEAAPYVDVLQIPAFLSRQTDLLVAAARTGKPVNVKKGQFLAPLDMKHPIQKVRESGNPRVFITERGVSFGYNNLVVDMRAFPMMRPLGVPIVFDVTHSLQLPGGGDGVTAGLGEYIEVLARAGVAASVDGVFIEVHDDPPKARSDAQNALHLARLEPLLDQLTQINAIAKSASPVSR
jgi:2-dehydro-3-deoxyphosphooctonate aldolase (KDO 8-P synthase)